MVNHKERAHALLSASGASRWMTCTPSARLEENFSDTTSDYAREGTLAHEISELYVKKEIGQLSTRSFNSSLKKLKEDQLYQEEMANYCQAYADYVLEKIKKPATVLIEERLDFSQYVPEGFGTGDCIVLQDKALTIIDFKYGKGVEVSAESNKQMMLYGLGAVDMFELFYDFDVVELCIFQPRIGNISEWQISVEDLVEWGKNFAAPKAKLAYEGKGEFSAGDHCRFCRASGQCKAQADFALSVIAEEFQDESGELNTELLNTDDYMNILEKIDVVKDWISKVQDKALHLMLYEDKTIPGYKVVEGRSNRVYTNQDEVVKRLVDNGYPEASLFEKKLYGISAMEKLLKKKTFNELIGDLVEKPKGKPTIAPESDKRSIYSLVDFEDETL